MFLAFPLCERWLRAAGRNVGFVFFDFGRRGVPLLAWLLFTLGLLGYGIGAGELSVDLVLRWGLSSLVVVLVLGLDLMGSTPTYKSGLHEDRLLRIALDDRSCRAAGFCEEVCPTDVFDVAYDRRVARLPGAERCVQCGACIVQCPFDALHFESPSGGVVRPETVRRFKLNLLGRRMAAPRT
jgi:ferredoxin